MRALAPLLLTLLLGVASGATALAQPPSPDPAVVEATLRARFGPELRVDWNATRTAPRRLTGLRVPTRGEGDGERARGFLLEHRTLVGLDGDVRLLEARAARSLDPAARIAGKRVVRMQQLWQGLPVEGRTVVVRLDEAGRVTAVTSDLGPLDVPAPARIVDVADARAAIARTYETAAIGEPTQVVLAHGSAGRVAWRFPVALVPLVAHFYVWVDAATGAVLKSAPAGFDQVLTELPLRDAEVLP